MFVGVDIGGTKVMAIALPDRGAAPIAAVELPMPGREASEHEVEDAVDEAVRRVLGTAPGTAVGVASAGLIDAAGERVRFSAHVPWRDAPVRARFAARWGVPVILDNDANCAAHAELAAGAGRSADSMIMVTVGTGIGGAIVLGGRVRRGASGMAGEFGHMQLVPNGRECQCGLRGCWEQYCSGRALTRFVADADGSARTGPEITAAAEAGDPVALAAFDAVGSWLGVGTAALVSAFDPGMVVVGGGVSASGDLLLAPARVALHNSLQAAESRDVPPILPASYGPEASAVGAALLARDQHH